MNGRAKRCIVCGNKGSLYPTVNGLLMCSSCSHAFNLGIKYVKSTEYTEKDIVSRVDSLECRMDDAVNRLRSLDNLVMRRL